MCTKINSAPSTLISFISLNVVQLEQVLRKSQNWNVPGQTLAVADFPRTVPPSSWTQVLGMLLPYAVLFQVRNEVAGTALILSTRPRVQIAVRGLICKLEINEGNRSPVPTKRLFQINDQRFRNWVRRWKHGISAIGKERRSAGDMWRFQQRGGLDFKIAIQV